MPSDAIHREDSLPLLVKVATGLQVLLLAVIAIAWAGWAARGRLPISLLTSAAIFAPSLILCAVSVAGMARGKTYGWICGLVGNLATSAVFAIFAGALTVFPFGIIGVLMLRGVRDFFTRNQQQ